jgi:hypothetical protein
MPTPSKTTAASAKRTEKVSSKAPARRSKTRGKAHAKKSATHIAITTELAPAVAIALLDKTEHAPGAPAPALECLAAGASASDVAGMVRVQLMFENGTVLPVEMSADAGAALQKGLAEELPKKLPKK